MQDLPELEVLLRPAMVPCGFRHLAKKLSGRWTRLDTG